MKKFLITSASFLFPVMAFAQSVDTGYIEGLLGSISDILNLVLPLLIAVAVVYFVYNVVKFVVAGDEEAKKQAKDRIIYGIIGLFVIVAVWGLVNLLATVVGVETGGNVDSQIPSLPVVN